MSKDSQRNAGLAFGIIFLILFLALYSEGVA